MVWLDFRSLRVSVFSPCPSPAWQGSGICLAGRPPSPGALRAGWRTRVERRVCCVRGPGGWRAPQSPVGKLLVSTLHLSIKLWAALCVGLSLQEGSEPAVTPPSRLCCWFLLLGPVGQGPTLAVQLLRTAATAPQTPAVGGGCPFHTEGTSTALGDQPLWLCLTSSKTLCRCAGASQGPEPRDFLLASPASLLAPRAAEDQYLQTVLGYEVYLDLLKYVT